LANPVIGDLEVVTGEFLIAKQRTDPTTVKVKWKTPAGVVTTWTYLTNSEVVKDAVGYYHANLNLTEAGTWNYRWEGTGTAQGANQDSFIVDASKT